MKEYKHKVESEVANKNGAWKPIPMAMSQDVNKSLKRIMKKYEGKLSVDAMNLIICQNAWHECAFVGAMSATFTKPKKQSR